MKSLTFVALTSVAAAISADELEFTNYVARYNKVYEDIKEFALRFERFSHWHRIISEHNNSNYVNFTLGHNQFSDWTDSEYKAILAYVRGGADVNHLSKYKVTDCDSDDSDLPTYVNWVEAGAVTPVKDQLHCGACWAFAAIGAMEGAYFAQTGKLLTLSEQQLIDCDINHDPWDHTNKGCNGGDFEIAFEYFKDNSPTLESVYPYTSGSGDDSTDCIYSASEATNIKVKV